VREAIATALAHTGGPVVAVLTDPYALAIPAHVLADTAAGFTLSTARQVFGGRLDDVIETARHNTRFI
jgi:pyruvate dehydrogenase (quinone)